MSSFLQDLGTNLPWDGKVLFITLSEILMVGGNSMRVLDAPDMYSRSRETPSNDFWATLILFTFRSDLKVKLRIFIVVYCLLGRNPIVNSTC
jgi:hypothetical protein